MKLTELIMAAKPSTSSPPPPQQPLPPQQQPSSPSHHRSVLAIDLNQVPETLPSPSSSSSSRSYLLLSPTTLVRSFHDNPTPPEGAPAEIPVGGGFCGVCGRPPSESTSERLVCDGCERVFHFSCAGVLPSLLEEDWVCRFCVADGGSSNRWRLGRKEERGVRFIDMNASPPSDGDADVAASASSAASSRNLCFGNNSISGYTGGVLRSYPNFIYSGNGFGLQKASTIVAHTVRLDVQDILHNKRSTARSIEDIQYGSQLGQIRSSGTTFRLPSWNSNEVLQSLRDFVSERHGVLEEGWRVEFKQSKNGCESYAVYCAPDGRIFETMSDVANYLGLASNGNSGQPETRSDYGSTLRKNGLHQPKRRKLTKIPVGNGFMENKDSLASGYNGFFPNAQKDQLLSKSEKVEATESLQEEMGVNDFHHFHEGLPLQYEDFFVLSLGKVDARTSYHDARHIWPVGYRSCWHDKVTGSLFLCHVLDGGDTGPIFKVRRVSCSALPIPYGSTFLQRQSGICLNDPNKETGEQTIPMEEEFSIDMLLSEPCFPTEDSLSWLLSSSNEVDGQNIIHLSHDVNSTSERSLDLLAHSSSTCEKNGEFSVDGNSSSLVWSILSQKLVDTCHQIYKEKGSLQFFCKHVKDGMSSFYDIMTNKNRDVFFSLDRFCSLLGSLKVPSVVKSDDELESTLESLRKWFSLDRFGLDVGFVQELIEQSPDVHRCPQYETVKRRNDCLTAPLVQNGLLLINGKSMEQCSTEFNGLYKDYRRIEEPDCSNHNRPIGNPLGAKLPPRFIGDVFQVWELLRRFHEILGLDPLNFDELEDELISPWFENPSLYGSCEKESPCGQAESIDGSSFLSEHTSSSSEIIRPDENRFIELQSSSMRGEAHATLLSCPDNNCSGLSLKRAHISLLDVLISELQIKVAAMVDPSIDAESKSRRGRRKDVDTSILAIRPKLNLLPINELTWPELARRYILAVLSMDGNLDSTETGIRECGKVLRCLQGDGGVLCGSLVGVEGIEADALLLAEAKKRIYGSLCSEDTHLTIEEDEPEPAGTSGRTGIDDGNIPEWAQVLEPVRKLPTNVGTRIRKCVYEALAKDPPDWAKKILEHSISKEVYKGNASGPTKKAVLSVLADVLGEGMQQKTPKERKKKKTIVSISDTIMKKCRILLRRAAFADEEKVFCNLVGRNLIHSSENDDEGLLGSPGMVSRPLDFRTIDLRLACGAYRGSHEAFLEDVRELWNNIRVAHTEQPELVQLAERLSENFELLYEEEVVALVDKLKEYSEMKHISTEAKNEIEEVLSSTSDIPKAPWDEGVCKVCGIDKDDDSVLLCDTCDAEYHTYCLNPPLARIPEGNWYCPACVSGVSVLERSSKGVKFVGQRHRRKNHGEGIRNYLEELARLVSVIEQKGYWEFSVEEKILLLKFLSDEVLNSIVIRQHLEQCFETSADLHQKLRILYSEWKNSKLREDILANAVTKSIPNVPVVAGDTSIAVNIDPVTNSTVGTDLKHESDPIPSNSDTTKAKMEADVSLSSNQRKSQSVNHPEKLNANYSRVKQPVDSELNDNNTPLENKDLDERSSKRRKSSSLQDFSVSNTTVLPETSGMDSESSCQIRSEDPQETIACSTPNGNDTVQKELSVLQQSIVNAESQLVKSSVRLEFLGSDSSGRLYWASALPGSHPRVIVDCTIALQTKKESSNLRLQGSNASCPFVYEQDHSDSTSLQWVYYQSEDEIKELVKSLKLNNPKERELKDSIMNWKKLRFHGLHQTASQDRIPVSVSTSGEESEMPGVLITRADTLLEGKYGPFCQVERLEDVKKRLRRSKGSNDEKLYRCRCLEPIWFSRHHCLVCHKTFYTSLQLDRHNGGKCKSSYSTAGKRKDSNEPVGEKVSRKSETQPHLAKVKDKVQASKNVDSDLSRHVKFQNEGSRCPYRFEEISSKFVTNDSIKELVHGIGLIGSDGTPSFVSSPSPYLNDPTLRVVGAKQDIATDFGTSKIPEQGVSQTVTRVGNMTDSSTQKLLAKKDDEISDSGLLRGSSHERSTKGLTSNFGSFVSTDPYSMVPEASMKPLFGRASQILKKLKMCLLDMEAALPEEALRPSKVHPEKRRAWHAFVKASETIFEMVQATIVLEDMIKADYLKTERWYWSSLSAAAKTSTLSSLALRIFALDNAIVYANTSDLTSTSSLKPIADLDEQSPSNIDSSEKSKQTRRTSSRRKRDAES